MVIDMIARCSLVLGLSASCLPTNLGGCLTEMVDAMRQVAELNSELTVEERNLLSVAYKVPYSFPSIIVPLCYCFKRGRSFEDSR
jgi:hypothetical protein